MSLDLERIRRRAEIMPSSEEEDEISDDNNDNYDEDEENINYSRKARTSRKADDLLSGAVPASSSDEDDEDDEDDDEEEEEEDDDEEDDDDDNEEEEEHQHKKIREIPDRSVDMHRIRRRAETHASDEESSESEEEDDEDEDEDLSDESQEEPEEDDATSDDGSDSDIDDTNVKSAWKKYRKTKVQDIPLMERLAMQMDGGDGARSILPRRSNERKKKAATTSGSADEDDSDGSDGSDGDKDATRKRRGKVLRQKGAEEPSSSSSSSSSSTTTKKRKSKHAPMEMSTKRAVGRHREVVEVKVRGRGRFALRDPRFEPMSSTAPSAEAEREYNALLDDKREEELGAVRRAIKKEKRRRGGRAAASEDAKLSVLERSLARLKQTRAERQVAESRRAALAQWKSSEREKVAAGKKPFFLKKRAQKELETEHRFEALAKGRGGKKKIEKLIEKRRKKNAAKDRRWLPEARRGAY